MTDSFLAKGKRKKLVEELRHKGITDEEVLRAINAVPRHDFMDPAFLNHAYTDKAFPISAGQTISQPYTVAVQTQLLQVKKRDKVLEIGTGSGYQCAILAEMGAKVYTIERYRELYLKAQRTLLSLGYTADFFFGDGYEVSHSMDIRRNCDNCNNTEPDKLLRQQNRELARLKQHFSGDDPGYQEGRR
jgi:protein-L-isoaspartate(D-aspartate) O-methyltransferase